jgi:hypothetical protein
MPSTTHENHSPVTYFSVWTANISYPPLHRSSYLSRSVGFYFKTPIFFQHRASLGIWILTEQIACSHKLTLWWRFYGGAMASIKLQGSKYGQVHSLGA